MRESNRETNVAGYLLDVSTGLDISGRNLDRWSNTIVTEILDAYPRLKIADEFSSLIEDQAIRKPDSAAADAVRSGILDRIASNPLDQ